MDPAIQDKLYTKLYRIWDREHSTPKIQKIANNGQFLNDIRALVRYIKGELAATTNPIIKMIHEKSLENIRYMMSDFLRVRAQKILEMAQDNGHIDKNTLYDFEWHYFQQLVPAFKGYSKATQIILQEMESSPKSKRRAQKEETQDLQPPPDFQDDLPQEESPSGPSTPSAPILASELGERPSSKGLTGAQRVDPLPSYQKERDRDAAHTLASSPHPMHIDMASPDYATIITLRDIPAFVGSDLQTYGPMVQGEIALIPEINAKILLEENMLKIIKDNNKE